MLFPSPLGRAPMRTTAHDEGSTEGVVGGKMRLRLMLAAASTRFTEEREGGNTALFEAILK